MDASVRALGASNDGWSSVTTKDCLPTGTSEHLFSRPVLAASSTPELPPQRPPSVKIAGGGHLDRAGSNSSFLSRLASTLQALAGRRTAPRAPLRLSCPLHVGVRAAVLAVKSRDSTLPGRPQVVFGCGWYPSAIAPPAVRGNKRDLPVRGNNSFCVC